MKSIYLLIPVLLACSSPKSSEQSKSITSEEISTNTEAQVEYINFDEPSDCQYEYYLSSEAVSQEAKEFWKEERKPSDDEATWKVLNELISTSDELRPFYFLVVSKIMSNTDGALTEMTVEIANKFVFKTNTKDFYSYTAGEHCLINRKNFSYSNWAQQLGYAISMECDEQSNYESCVRSKFKELQDKCSTCNLEELRTRTKGWL